MGAPPPTTSTRTGPPQNFDDGPVPARLVAILDGRAGKTHSADGPVMAALAEILAEHETIVRDAIVERIELARLAGLCTPLALSSEMAAWDRGMQRAAAIARGDDAYLTPEPRREPRAYQYPVGGLPHDPTPEQLALIASGDWPIRQPDGTSRTLREVLGDE